MSEDQEQFMMRITNTLRGLAAKIDEAKEGADAPAQIAEGDQISAKALDFVITQLYAQLSMLKTRAERGPNDEGARLMFLARAVQLKGLVHNQPDLALFVLNRLVEMQVDFLVAAWGGDVNMAYKGFTDEDTPLIPHVEYLKGQTSASEAAS